MSEDPQGTAPTLVVTGGPSDGLVVAFEGAAERILGSGTRAQVRLPLGNVDDAHAKISHTQRGLGIEDLGSASGTYVNGERVTGRRELRDGDRVCLGPPGSQGSVKLIARVPLPAPAADADLLEDDAILLDAPQAASPQPLPPVTLDTQSESMVLDHAGAAEDPPLAPVYEFIPPPAVPSPIPPPPPPPAFDEPATPPPPPPVMVEFDEPEVVTAAPAAAAKPPRAASRPVAAGEYTDQPPSIAPERVREALSMPVRPARAAAATKPAPKRRRSTIPNVPRPVMFAAAGAIGLAAVWGAFGLLVKPKPQATSVMPARVEAGKSVTIAGSGFESDAARNVVRFGETPGQVSAASATQLNVVVPASLAGNVELSVETRGGRSGALPLTVFVPPTIEALDPEIAMPGEEVTLRGAHLAGAKTMVTVSGFPGVVVEAQPDKVRFRVPGDLPFVSGRGALVTYQVDGVAGRPATLLLGRLPLLAELSPNKGQAGDRVVLKGRGFDPIASNNAVAFGGLPALVIQAAPTELVVSTPSAGVSSGAHVEAVVTVAGKPSTPLAFDIVRPSAGIYVPRYFAAPVTEHAGDLAFVSCDLGPVLVLSGKSEAASTAERAVQTAAALNVLMDRAQTQPVTLEVRSQPAPSVAVAGVEKPLLVVTEADAAAYSLAWDPSVRGRSFSALRVATHWSALLQDHVALFARRERPTKVLESSPRGKALIEIYSESVRRTGAGGGVPIGAVNPLTANLAKALRDMALLLPGEAQGTRGAAVSGRWSGMLQDQGGAQSFEVVFRSEGPRLAGSMRLGKGAVSVEVPLRDVSYAGGAIRFTSTAGGAQRFFRGNLVAETINGTIHDSVNAKAATGQFELKFVQ